MHEYNQYLKGKRTQSQQNNSAKSINYIFFSRNRIKKNTETHHNQWTHFNTQKESVVWDIEKHFYCSFLLATDWFSCVLGVWTRRKNQRIANITIFFESFVLEFSTHQINVSKHIWYVLCGTTTTTTTIVQRKCKGPRVRLCLLVLRFKHWNTFTHIRRIEVYNVRASVNAYRFNTKQWKRRPFVWAAEREHKKKLSQFFLFTS